MASHISYELRERVAYITIERPERLNALGLQTLSELADAFLEASDSASAQVIVLTAAGDRAFCAGLDLKEADELAQAGKRFAQPMRGRDRNLFELILEAPKPTIAAINGDAVGGGCEIALACDLRVAADHARIGMPEAKRGMGANFGSVLLPRLMPRAIALEMLYTGRLITAEEAQQHGLLNRRFPKAEFRAEVSQYAAAIAENAPLTLQRYKHMTLKGWDLPVHAALRLDVGPNPYTSEDRIEGVRAFVEKRTPKWQGR